MVIIKWDGITTKFKKQPGTPSKYVESRYKYNEDPVNINWNALCTIEVNRLPLTSLRKFYVQDAKGIQGGFLLNIPAVEIEEGSDPDEATYCVVLTPLEENELIKIGIG